ncbi:Myelin protein zero-like protein 3 [Camelus dromedarius]|uniref:Myelin protein zero-like protein 3 n=1 Tax=Camelus dromedarius TaxID=9838 RepID=A0A5N4C9N6_CAMDR|nr:Myelin protein zero-like protein 3 [Camelus dromedarius]
MQQSGAAGSHGCALCPLLGVLFFQGEVWKGGIQAEKEDLTLHRIRNTTPSQIGGIYIVLSLEIKADAHVRGYVGENIKLKCTFKSTSSVTDKLTIDWTYRPPSSSRTESIFHYQSFQYPTTAGTFRDRISWVGDVYKGDASISISNPTIKDNGTFSCAVKNPPDVHHNIPVTELTVTERDFGTMLSSVALLSILVFIPSAVVVVLLLVRMGRKSAGLKKRSRSGYKKSSIEVSDDTDQEEENDCMAKLCVRCAECLPPQIARIWFALSLTFHAGRRLLSRTWRLQLRERSVHRFSWCSSSWVEDFVDENTYYSLGLDDSIELTVSVGDSALMGCVFQSVEEKHVTKVDWMFSSGERVKDDFVLFYYANISVPVGRFQNRARLVGDISHHDGSLLLQNVEEADQGTYTCEIRFKMESLVFKKAVVLHVLPEEPTELMVHVGDSTQMGCVFQSTEEKHVTRVDWMFSPGERAKIIPTKSHLYSLESYALSEWVRECGIMVEYGELHVVPGSPLELVMNVDVIDQEEIVLRYYPKLNASKGYPQNWGRFQNRVNLVGDISHNDGSIRLQGVKESDGGNYTCTLVTPAALIPEILGGNQLVTIVGIICTTILLLPVLILIVKRTHRNKSSVTSTTLVRSLENTNKAHPEKHIYSSITTQEVIDEEESSGKPEATYMTMHPVRPSLRSAPPSGPLDNKSVGGMPKSEQAF